MAKLTKISHRLQLKLTHKERQSLITVRDTDTKAYRRERAAGLFLSPPVNPLMPLPKAACCPKEIPTRFIAGSKLSSKTASRV